MPTINKTFLLKLLLAVVALGGVLVGVHAVQARRIPDALRRQADRATAAGKTDAAIHYLRQYLEFRPADVDVQDRLAELLRGRSGDEARSSLIFLYDKILRADPGRNATRREALKLCLRVGRYTDAAGHAETLLKESPTDAELWQQLAAAQAALRQNDAAVRSYEAALKHDPKSLVAYQRLAQFHWRDLKRSDDAKAVIDRMVAALPSDPEAHLTRAKFLGFTQDALPRPAADPVLADLDKALALDPHNPEAALLKAERLQRHRDLHGAFACLTEALKRHPGDVRLVRSLAWLEVNRGNTGGAVAVLEDGLHTTKDGNELLVPLADLLLQYGEASRTEEIIRKLDGRAGPTVKLQSKYLRGRLAMHQNRWDDAIGLLTSLRADAIRLPGLEAQANLLLAACHRQKGETEQELECLKLITAKDPGHLAARVALGQLHLDAGQFADAIREYEAAAQSPYATGPVCATLVRLKTARLAAGGGAGWAELERQVVDLAPRFGAGSVEPTLLLAEIATAAGSPDRSAAILRKESARRPGDVRLWAALAEAVADAAGVAAGLAVVDEGMSASGDGVDLRLTRAGLYARDPARLRPIPALEAQTDSWPDADQFRLMHGLIEVYDRVGDEPNVIRLYRRLASRRPNDLAVWESLYARAVASRDGATAAVALAAVKRIDGDDGSAVVRCRAWAALAGKSPDAVAAARVLLVKTFGPTPAGGDACLALARLHAAGGDAKEADRLFARAARLDPGRFETGRAYLAHLATLGRSDAVARQLARLAADPRWSGEPFRRLVRRTAESLEPQPARKLVEAAARFVEPLPGGRGWLAGCYLVLGLRAEATSAAEAVTRTKLSTPDDWLRLALLREPKGGEVLADLRAKLPEPTFAAVAAAFAETPAGKNWRPELSTPAARRAYTQARLNLKLARLERVDAITLLESYLTGKPPDTDAAWAKRNLAILLVIRGEPSDRQRAMAIVAADANLSAKSAEEKRSTAAVLTSLYRYLDGEDRQTVLGHAIAVLEDVAKTGGTARDGFILTQVYRAASRQKDAVALLDRLLKTDPANLDYLLAGLDLVVEANELAEAARWAERLLSLYPADFRVVASVARYECKAKRPEKAFELVRDYIRAADATGTELTAKLVRAAELLDELSRRPGVARSPLGRAMVDFAVTQYETALAGRSESVVAVAGLLAADGRVNEAFAKIDRAGRVLTARSKTAAGLAALRSGGGSEKQFAQVRQWLDAGRGEEPDSVALRLSEAEFFALKHDYAAAAAAYEDVLKLDPRNVVALNNLAWILSPRPESSDRALRLISRAIQETGVTAELLDTRARVRIAARQLAPAEADLREALRQGRTPLRLFHYALAKQSQDPPRRDEAEQAFREARNRGLGPKTVHPDDLPTYRALVGADKPGS
jgi:tetratricopeptide (TPR) repeat protein